MRELPQPKKAYTLFRGEYDQRRDEVQAGTPSRAVALSRRCTAQSARTGEVAHRSASSADRARHGQSHLAEPVRPRTGEDGGGFWQPRVPAQSIRRCSTSFASGFIDSGWDVKRLVKTIVMSRTYRQRSMADAQTMADDPDNEWLARGSRFRLPAEMIRDNALAAAGLLKLPSWRSARESLRDERIVQAGES